VTHERLYELLDGWADGTLTDIESAELNTGLSDAVLCREAALYMDQHFALREFLSTPVLSATPFANRNRRITRSSWVAVAGLTALVAVCLALLFRPATNTVVTALPQHPVENTGSQVAHVVVADDCVFPTSGRSLALGDLVQTGTYQLLSGRIVLVFLSGVEFVIEGPAQWDVLSVDRIECRQGRLRAYVPPGAEGFAVLAPGVQVVDLGTEFGMNIAPSGQTSVLVFEGKVEVSALNPAGKAQDTKVLEKDAGAEINTQLHQILPGNADVAKFATKPLVPRPLLVLDAQYSSLIKESKPWGYWRFEALQAGKYANEIEAGAAFTATGDLTSTTEGENRSVVFKESESPQYAVLDGAWSIQSDYAVEFWMLLESSRKSTVVSVSKSESSKGSYVILETKGFEPKSEKPASLRYLHRNSIELSGNNLFARSIFPFRWHHIVVQKRGVELEMYVDGNLSASSVLEDKGAEISGRVVLGRLWNQLTEDTKNTRPFFGRIDELALYNQSLRAEVVLSHAAAKRALK